MTKSDLSVAFTHREGDIDKTGKSSQEDIAAHGDR